MISKILFTLAIILAVVWFWRTRRAHGLPPRPEPRVINPPPQPRVPVRLLATGVITLMILASAFLLYDHWRDSSEVIFIRVVDATSGRASEYRAQRGDINDREFVTTDGRHVVLAETERLETSTIRSQGLSDQN